MAKGKPIFETETCSRCGGSGHYSYCQRYGTTCFRCGGRGYTLTKRGAAANSYLVGLLSKPAREIVPGMVIQQANVTMGGDVYHEWYKVESVGPDETKQTDLRLELKAVKNPERGMTCYVSGDTVIRVSHTAEQKAPLIEKALAYQATLSKLGKPYKRKEGRGNGVAEKTEQAGPQTPAGNHGENDSSGISE